MKVLVFHCRKLLEINCRKLLVFTCFLQPHQNMEDMAVVYRFVLSSDDDGRASILVTNQLLENMGVTPEQLHADAMENAPQIKPVEIKGMSEVMAEMMGVEQAEMMGIFPVAPEDEKIYVATVPDKVHGAGVLAYQNFMDQAAERAGGDFFILPSSIHEVLIVPDNGEMGLKDLQMQRSCTAFFWIGSVYPGKMAGWMMQGVFMSITQSKV